MATRRESRERCRSVSMNRAPSSTPRRKAARVFSGAYPDAPRCATTHTCDLSLRPEVLGNSSKGSCTGRTIVAELIGRELRGNPAVPIPHLTRGMWDQPLLLDEGEK